MSEKEFLFEKKLSLAERSPLKVLNPLPYRLFFLKNLTTRFRIRDYQREALDRLKLCFENRPNGFDEPLHLLFHMATGSGKTFLMAANILYLYEQGYRNFLFFVNSTTIVRKTRDNFLNKMSSKYLFHERIFFEDKEVFVKEVQNFQFVCDRSINIVFITVQGLHSWVSAPQENVMTFEDFEDQRVVFLSDEAHHSNALTRKKSLMTQAEIKDNRSWENTVDRCFLSNRHNILLEYTATMDLENREIFKKYRKKIAYRYTLKNLRKDKYSKEVCIVQSDCSFKDRILQAVLLSHYRQKVAEKYRIKLKPVLLMKSQKTIAQSHEAQVCFCVIIRELKEGDLRRIDNNNPEGILRKAFDFFDMQGICYENLIREIQVDFAEETCLEINSKSHSVDKFLALNTLEQEENRIRVIFTVNMLNEGWDVLNLFDIVRLYETPKWEKKRRSQREKITLSEAQLIGRGARYNPFALKVDDNPFKRKYDDDIHNELRILEELHYHSVRDLQYIGDLRSELIRVGIAPSDFERKIRRKQRKTQRQVDRDHWENLWDKSPFEEPFRYRWNSSQTKILTVFDDTSLKEETPEGWTRQTLSLHSVNRHIKRKALDKIFFYRFAHLKKRFPHLRSIEEFILSDKYLGGVCAEIWGVEEQLKCLGSQEKYTIAHDILRNLARRIALNRKEEKLSFV